MVRIHLGTSEGSILNIRPPDGVGIVFELSLSWRKLLRTGRLVKKILSDEELLIVLRWQTHFDGDQREAAISWLLAYALYCSD